MNSVTWPHLAARHYGKWRLSSSQVPGHKLGAASQSASSTPLHTGPGVRQAAARPRGLIHSLGRQLPLEALALPLPTVRPAPGLPAELKTGSQQRPAEENTTAGVSVGLQANFPPALGQLCPAHPLPALSVLGGWEVSCPNAGAALRFLWGLFLEAAPASLLTHRKHSVTRSAHRVILRGLKLSPAGATSTPGPL